MNTATHLSNEKTTKTSSSSDAPTSWSTPRVDIFENANEFLLIVDVPGVSNEGITLEVHHGQLKIEACGESGRNSRNYRRIFQLPDTIDGERITAEQRNGVLHIHLSKAPESKPRRIQVGSPN